jgi:hypothetical protein
MCDADFGNFDTNLRADFMEVAGQIVIDTICSIRQSEDDRLVMDVLWSEIIETFHLSYDMVHLTHHGNPSGNPLTTVVNCIVNLLYHWYAYIRISGNTGWAHFAKDVYPCTFGDDIVFSTDVADTQYSFNNVQAIMAELGQVYTAGDKSTTSRMKTIDEIQFLKRHFRKVSNTCYLAPLDTESIEQQFNWTNIAENDIPTVKVQIDEALLEAAIHGKFYFNAFALKLMNKIRSHTYLRNSFPGRFYYNDSHQQLMKRIDVMV